MPNHVENWLTFGGEEKEVQRALDQLKSDESALDFNKLIPYPEHFKLLDTAAEKWEKNHQSDPFKNRPDDGYNSGGYAWCIENWNTKWNAYSISGPIWDSRKLKGFRKAHILFETAWTPPLPIIERLHELFPDIDITLNYFEQGAQFAGELYFIRKEYLEEDEEPKEEWKTKDYSGTRGG